MATSTTKTNKPINPRGNDQSPKGYNRAALYSGKALDFDGVNDSVTTSNNLPFTNGADLSIVSYFKIDDVDEGYFYQNGAIYLAVYRDGATSSGQLSGFVSGGWLDTGYIVNDSKWYQVAQIVDNGTQRIYLNGQEIATQSGVTYNPSAQTALNIGKRDSNYLNGQMANLKAFNTALTAAQVADLYNNPEKIVPTGVEDTALKLWLPMMEGAGTTAYDGSPSGFVEDIVTGFTNGTTYPLDSFASNDDDITTAIKTSGFGGCVSNGHYYTNGQKVKVKFTYQKNSGDDLRVLFSSLVTGAGTAKSDIQYISASGEFEHTFTMTADGIAYLQLGTGNASHSIDAVITDVYVSPYKSTNHGTISGATYVNGVGAPVAQSAVIDWNKGTNIFVNSIDPSAGNWTTYTDTTLTGGQADAIGGTNGFLFAWSTGSGQRAFYQTYSDNGTYSVSVYAKAGTHDCFQILFANDGSNYVNFDLTNATTNVYAGGSSSIEAYGTDGWYKCEYIYTSTAATRLNFWAVDDVNAGRAASITSAGNINMAFPNKSQTSSVGPYIPTLSTAQTSDVLLPQGLTSGRDITGVNLFENVRKQGALNLDGNSWAEVHDNASLDMTTGVSVEAWVYWDDASSSYGILGKYNTTADKREFLLFKSNTTKATFNISANGTGTAAGVNSIDLTANQWYHLVGTYDGSNVKIYTNGAESSSTASSVTLFSSDSDLDIGRFNNSNEYTNAIAQPRIYNRALTAEEVERNYTAGKYIYTND